MSGPALIELRPIGRDDGPALGRVVADDEVARWLAPANSSGRLSADELVQSAERKAAHWEAHGFGQWLALIDGEPVGRGGLQYTVVGGRGEVEIGWAVARSQWGQGVGSQLATRGMAFAAELGIAGVVAFARPDNARSLALIAHCGMTFEREVEHAGWPHVLYRA